MILCISLVSLHFASSDVQLQLLPASSEEQPGRLEERQAGRQAGRQGARQERARQGGREPDREGGSQEVFLPSWLLLNAGWL